MYWAIERLDFGPDVHKRTIELVLNMRRARQESYNLHIKL